MDTPPDNTWKYAIDAVAGLDWSIRSPAIAVIPPCTDNTIIVPFEKCKFYFLTNRKALAKTTSNLYGTCLGENASYETLANWAIEVLKENNCSTVGLEDYAYGTNHIHTLVQLAENTGILKLYLHNHAIDYNLYSPTSIKKFATSSGRAKKSDMYQAFVEDTEIALNDIFGRKESASPRSPITDIVDAYYIALSQRADMNHTNYFYQKGNK